MENPPPPTVNTPDVLEIPVVPVVLD